MTKKITCPYCNTEQTFALYPSDLRLGQLHKICSECKDIFAIEIEIAFRARGIKTLEFEEAPKKGQKGVARYSNEDEESDEE